VSLARYRVTIPADAPAWARQLETQVNNILIRIARDMKAPRHTVADLPTDDSIRLAIVIDEAGGVTLAFFDGSDWRRVQDRAVVS
jgi:hypothetical protein